MFTCLVSCDKSDENEDISPIGEPNRLVFDEQSYTLENGLLLNRKESGNHYKINFMVTDGAFTAVDVFIGNVPITYWYFIGETVSLDLRLFAPGTTNFNIGTFNYSELSEDDLGENLDLADEFLFTKSQVGLDVNNDGEVEDETELFDVTGGTITVEGSFPDFRIVFDLVLENGQSVSGNYETEYAVWPVE